MGVWSIWTSSDRLGRRDRTPYQIHVPAILSMCLLLMHSHHQSKHSTLNTRNRHIKKNKHNANWTLESTPWKSKPNELLFSCIDEGHTQKGPDWINPNSPNCYYNTGPTGYQHQLQKPCTYKSTPAAKHPEETKHGPTWVSTSKELRDTERCLHPLKRLPSDSLSNPNLLFIKSTDFKYLIWQMHSRCFL